MVLIEFHFGGCYDWSVTEGVWNIAPAYGDTGWEKTYVGTRSTLYIKP